MKVSVVMAVFNERTYSDEIIKRVVSSPVDKELVIVDDYSTDGVLSACKRLSAD